MRRLPLLAALLISLNAQAAPASSESVQKMLALTHAEHLMDSIWPTLEAQFRQAVAARRGGQAVSAEQQAADDNTVRRLLALMHEQMGWQQLEPEYVRLYSETFSQEEVDGLNAFYATPAGQAYIAKMPQLMQRMMPLMQTHMAAMMPRMTQIIVESNAAPAAQ